MGKRSTEWEIGLAKRLKNKEYARSFILTCQEEGIEMKDCLRQFVQCYGVKEFSKLSNLPSSNISRILRKDYNPTLETINKFLAPFQLVLKLGEMKKRA